MWNETIRKKKKRKSELLQEVLMPKASSWPNMFSSPCSVFQLLTLSLYPLRTITLSPFQNTISQLKCLCHIVSCLKLICFSSRGESNAEKERKRNKKNKKKVKKSREITDRSSNPEIQNRHVGGLERVRVCFTSPMLPVHYVLLPHYHNGELLTT